MIYLRWKLLNWIPSQYLLHHPSLTFLNKNFFCFFSMKSLEKNQKYATPMVYHKNTRKRVMRVFTLFLLFLPFNKLKSIILPKDCKKQKSLINIYHLFPSLPKWLPMYNPIQIANGLFIAIFTDNNCDQSFVSRKITNELAFSNLRHIDDEPCIWLYLILPTTMVFFQSLNLIYHKEHTIDHSQTDEDNSDMDATTKSPSIYKFLQPPSHLYFIQIISILVQSKKIKKSRLSCW